MQRFLLTNTSLSVAQEVDLAPLAHQLHTVLRLRAGAEILLLDGAGFEYQARLQQVERNRVSGLVLTQRPVQSEPPAVITLYQSSLKTDKFEWVLQKGTELGVTCFAPVVSERSIVRPGAALLKKYTRWHEIVREAAEQCGRGVLPSIAEPLTWPQAVGQGEGLRLVPWEAAELGAPGLGDIVNGLWGSNQLQISLAIGPEGGLTAGEVAAASAAGWQVVSLGPRVLRAETAALAALTIVLDRLGGLGSGALIAT